MFNLKNIILLITLLCSVNAFSAQVNVMSALTVEELRIEKAMLVIPKVVNQLDATVDEFILQLALLNFTNNNVEERLLLLLKEHGQALWTSAVKLFHESANLDDRPLYWARLKMTKALHQSSIFIQLPSKKQTDLLWTFELYSRGQDDIKFDQQNNKKILLLGFDPFLLDKNIEQNNPSGVIALAFDNLLVKYKDITAEIETLIVPVRFADFDQGIIEELLTPYFKTPYLKGHAVDMILTVSMGREEFDLERFPGLRRSSTAPDNLNVYTGANTQNPLIPMLKGKILDGGEFIESSLPIAEMIKAKGPYKIFDNRNVTIAAPSLISLINSEQHSMTPKNIIAVQGSGGGYLSNEISYRSLLLRDLYKPSLAVGHIHTPRVKSFDMQSQRDIINQISEMIKHSIHELK